MEALTGQVVPVCALMGGSRRGGGLQLRCPGSAVLLPSSGPDAFLLAAGGWDVSEPLW